MKIPHSLARALFHRALCLLAGVATVALAREAAAQRPLNLGFEMPGAAYPDRPWGWSLGWNAFAAGGSATFTLDSTVRAEGSRSLRIVAADSGSARPARATMLQLPADFARGRRVHVTGLVRTRALRGDARVLLEAWGDGTMAAADTFTAATSADAPGWQRFALDITIPNDPTIHSLVVSSVVAGAGTAWFDGFTMRLDGRALTALPADPGPPSAAGLAWLAAQSTPLTSVSVPAATAGDRDADLATFARIVGDARIVGLGESTHGTREFFQVKDRLLEYLVRVKGFDLFAIEANQLAVERLNAYVMGGSGTTRDAMRVMFRVWNTEEMLALVDRVRAHNAATPARPVRFVGYDMQDHRTPFDSLVAFVRTVEPGLEARVRAAASEYREQGTFATPNVPEAERARWHAGIDSVWRDVSARRATWLAAARTRGDSLRVEWAVQSAGLLRQAARLNVTLNSPDRDSLMAANLDWALRTLYPGARVVVWAHDVHVSHGGDAQRSFNGGAQMGAHLKRTYAHDYRAFSLLTRSGAYSATRSFTDHVIVPVTAFPAPDGSVEAALGLIARPSASVGLITDLRAARDAADADWLWMPRPIRHVGYAAYDYGFDLRGVLPLEFDGIVFIDRTTASRLLP